MGVMNLETILNKQIIEYMLGCISDGDLGPLQEIGLGREEITAIQGMKALDILRLAQCSGHILDIRVDRNRFHNMLSSLQSRSEEEKYKNELIKRGAPQPMMNSLFAITSTEFTNTRKLLGISDEGVGRIQEASEEDQVSIYEAYKILEKHISKISAKEWIEISETTGTSMRTIWQVIQQLNLHEDQLDMFGGH